MMSQTVKRLLIVTAVVSTYNTITYLLVWFRDAEPEYWDLSFWALVPQLLLTGLIFYSWTKQKFYPSLTSFSIFIFVNWIACILLITLNSYVYWTDDINAWPFSSSFLSAFGVPDFDSGAPLTGLFHSAWLDETENVIWEFDGGIGFSWLTFNILCAILFITLYYLSRKQDAGESIQAFQDRVEVSNSKICDCLVPVLSNKDSCDRCGGSLKSHEKSALPSCQRCRNPISEGQIYCSNCGEPLLAQNPNPLETEEVVCNQCGGDLAKHQKFCSRCGIEIDWTANKNEAEEISLPSNGIVRSENSKTLFSAMALPGKTVAIILLIFNVIVILSLFGSENSQDDLSRCNGNYDANILKTYGVFRCPAIYDSYSGEQTFSQDVLFGLFFINILVLIPLYLYAKWARGRATNG